MNVTGFERKILKQQQTLAKNQKLESEAADKKHNKINKKFAERAKQWD